MGPAAYLLGCRVLGTAARLTSEDCVVDRVGVGLDVAGEASEHLADGGACVLGLVLEEDVVLVGEHDEEVPLSTRLASTGRYGLDAHAGGVGRQTEGRLPGLLRGGVDDAAERRAQVLGVTAHRAVVELDAIGGEHEREAMKRDPPAVLAHDDVRDHRRSEQPSREQLLGHGRGDDLIIGSSSGRSDVLVDL